MLHKVIKAHVAGRCNDDEVFDQHTEQLIVVTTFKNAVRHMPVANQLKS